MTYGMRIYNTLGDTIISDQSISTVKVASGTVSPSCQSGDTVNWSTSGTTTMPYTDEIYGGSRETLYHYALGDFAGYPGPLANTFKNSFTFLKMGPVGSKFIFGGVSRGNPDAEPRIDLSGVFSTESTLSWATIAPRDINVAPTGFGLAMYRPDGKCGWATDDALAVVPLYVRSFDWLTDISWTVDFSGWLRLKLPGGMAGKGVAPPQYYGRFVRTSTGLDWKCNAKFNTTDWSDATGRQYERDNATSLWNGTGFFSGPVQSFQKLFLGSMG